METVERKPGKRIQTFLYALAFLTVLLGLSILLEGCSERCGQEVHYTYYEPVYETVESIRNAVAQIEPQPFEGIGKIYFKDGWMFVNQPGKGVHVIANQNPASPVMHSFINVPGSYELAVKGTTLYVDSYVDLVLLDISNINHIQEVGRMEGVFRSYTSMGISYDENNPVILTGFREKENVTITESDCSPNNSVQPWGGWWAEDRGGIFFASNTQFNQSAAMAPGTGSGPGVGGSMARFTISGNHLYMLDQNMVKSVDITSERNPQEKNSLDLDWGIETIFPYGNVLFVGAQTGMHILDVSVPGTPKKISTYAHVRVCDPVVVQGTTAYVTLRSGNQCMGFTNQLEVIDIADLKNPTVKAVHPMHNPHGLGIDGATLFICDGDAGLKIFHAGDVQKITENLLAHYEHINAYDVIPFNNVLMMIGADGIFQFDYSDPSDIKLLSQIALDPL